MLFARVKHCSTFIEKYSTRTFLLIAVSIERSKATFTVKSSMNGWCNTVKTLEHGKSFNGALYIL